MQNLRCSLLGIILLPSAEPSFGTSLPFLHAPLRCDDTVFAFLKSKKEDEDVAPSGKDSYSEELDTVRVRIWRQLADGKELSLTQLSNAVGERKLGNLRSHLTHVEKQAKTIRNKSDEWRVRRGLSPVGSEAGAPRQMKLRFRKGKKNEMFVRIV
jgi:hypothetical protein